jgi:hypothetical protein
MGYWEVFIYLEIFQMFLLLISFYFLLHINLYVARSFITPPYMHVF